VFGPYLLRGVVDLILATTRNLPVGMAALGLYGVGTSTGMVTYNSLLQAEVPALSRGRAFAGLDMIWQTGRLISLGLGGPTADALSIQAVYLIGGTLLLFAGTLGLAACGHPEARTPVLEPRDAGPPGSGLGLSELTAVSDALPSATCNPDRAIGARVFGADGLPVLVVNLQDCCGHQTAAPAQLAIGDPALGAQHAVRLTKRTTLLAHDPCVTVLAAPRQPV
jgi:hypothetical protein